MSSPDLKIRPWKLFSRSLKDLSYYVGSTFVGNDIQFTGITIDSRFVESGDLFIALQGAKEHGAIYAAEVVNKGAAAILTDSFGAKILSTLIPVIIVENPRMWVGAISAWFYNNPSSALDVIGITGTNGKTTTAALVEEIWRLDGRMTGFIGTIGIRINNENYATSFTTPEGTDLQGILAAMREQHVRNVVMEVSSHALSMHRVIGTHFKVVGFTNLTQDHLDFHGDMENYFRAKAELFALDYADSAIVNLDNLYGVKLFDSFKIPTKTYSRSHREADWHYQNYETSTNGIGFEVSIRGPGGVLIEGHLPLIGIHNLDNTLLAIALTVESGVDPIAVAAYLGNLSAPVGRLEPIDVGQKFLALVDYAHTPDAVAHALKSAKSMTKGKVIAVLGCGGDRDKGKRAIMGQALRAGADFAVFTSDNPRTEDPMQILMQMVGEGHNDNEVVELDRRSAIAIAVLQAEPGDCVIVLGKGHERGQEINGIKHLFDDRIELAHAIEDLE